MAKQPTPVGKKTPDARVHGGHRARMKEKLMLFGDQIFDDHELLEMLLYHAIPMRDTNPIAHRLLAVFGSVEGVFSATKEELMTVEGVKEKTAELILATGKIGDYPFFCKQNATKYNTHALLGQYFVQLFSEVAKTATYMMMLTNSMELIATEKVVDGELYICQRHTKEMIVSALKHGAALVVLAHNHPNGPCYDTQDDHFALNFIRSAFQNAGIYFIENYVISGSGYFSSMGKIDTLYLSQSPEVEQFLKEKEIMPNVYVAVRP